MNNFYFQGHGIAEFAGEFHKLGGKVLLIDQVFKHPDWSKELRKCYDLYPGLKIIFTGSSVMRLKEENPELNGIVSSYNLRGFSFREFLNLKAGTSFKAHRMDDILKNHTAIAREILNQVNPLQYFQDYVHHGFYPFFLQQRNYSENLLKTMNMMMEVDILLIKQIDLKYLAKIKKTETSRATVMNYIKYLADARLINMVYAKGDSFPKKPCRVLMHNSNLIYTIYPPRQDRQDVIDTFFVNSMWKDHVVHKGAKGWSFLVDGGINFKVSTVEGKTRQQADSFYAVDGLDKGHDNVIPLWMFGMLY